MVTWSAWIPRSVSSSSTSRYDSGKRRYQRTASTMTSAGNRKPAKSDRGTGLGRGQRVLMRPVSLLHSGRSERNSARKAEASDLQDHASSGRTSPTSTGGGGTGRVPAGDLGRPRLRPGHLPGGRRAGARPAGSSSWSGAGRRAARGRPAGTCHRQARDGRTGRGSLPGGARPMHLVIADLVDTAVRSGCHRTFDEAVGVVHKDLDPDRPCASGCGSVQPLFAGSPRKNGAPSTVSPTTPPRSHS
jgi:hypothetical protein